MADKYLNETGLTTLYNWIMSKLQGKVNTTDIATDSNYGVVKTNSAESVTLDSNGRLNVGGRLGQMSNTTGVYSPKSINPASVGNGSFLLTEASGTSLGSKSLGVTTGSGLSLKSSSSAGSTQYRVSNTYENRIICAGLVGGRLALSESSAATATYNILSVQINGQSFTPDSSANDSSKDIIITTSNSVNPNSSTSSVRPYCMGGNFSNLLVGQQVGGNSCGASVIVGQKVFSNSGNACALVGASIYNTGNGNAVFGRQHISKKNRSLLAGTGHDTSNAKGENVVAFGQWSNIESDTVLAIGNGTDQTTRSNLVEIKDTYTQFKNPVYIGTKNSSASDSNVNESFVVSSKTHPLIPVIRTGNFNTTSFRPYNRGVVLLGQKSSSDLGGVTSELCDLVIHSGRNNNSGDFAIQDQSIIMACEDNNQKYCRITVQSDGTITTRLLN